MEFARTIALGVAIGDVIANPFIKFFRPIITKAIPADYEKWVEIGIQYACKLFGFWIAIFVARMLAAVHSAMRGAKMFTTSFAVYAARRGYKHLSQGYWDDIFAGAVAILGVYWQVKAGFQLPFLLKLPLLPFILLEDWLFLFLGYTAK